jgi:hypothetical protein
MRRKSYPTQQTLRELFELRNGRLYWRIRPSHGTKAGSLAGHHRHDGSCVIVYQRRSYMAHLLIPIYTRGRYD